MNSSKKDKGRIFKQALLFSEKPTKKDVCIALFFHALMIALLVVCAFPPFPLASLVGGIGVIWFVSIALNLVIELTDNSDRYLWQIVNQVSRRAKSPTKSDKLIGIIVIVIACLILFALAIAAFVSGAFWLFNAGISGSLAIIFGYMIWHIWSIARQVKAQRRQEETA